MSVTFTKLFSSITESTIWCEDSDIRIVWITMLAMCDRHGRVWASLPGLANRAQVSLEMAEKAIDKFLSPDKYSRTPEYDGRRIEPIDGGWRLLNHEKYRAIRDEEERKEYKRKWIKEKREKEKAVDNVDQSRPQYTHTDTYTDTYTKEKDICQVKPDVDPPKKNNFKKTALEILDFLNEKCERKYKPTDTNLKFIIGRLKEGYTEQECRQVIAKKRREWIDNDKMREYLRPATLFNAEKFNQYVGELV